jgi:hypothetical protein
MSTSYGDGRAAARTPRHRALALSGGGPAVGVSLGFLKALALKEFRHIEFDVWTLSCVGAWLGCIYHMSPDGDPAARYEFAKKKMRDFFRPDESYQMFPCPTIFLPDLPDMMAAYLKFMVNPESYKNWIVPKDIAKGYGDLLDFYLKPSKWNQGDAAHVLLNAVLAPNPVSRFLMSMIYKSEIPGTNKLLFDPTRYSVLKDLNFARLEWKDVPTLYHNAYNVDAARRDEPKLQARKWEDPDPNEQIGLELFSNRNSDKNHKAFKPITVESLSACSGLPYILSPVKIRNGEYEDTYVEGATVDTVGFHDLLKNHVDHAEPGKELNEIWVSQILARKQIREHKNLLEALQNLVMMFACTTSEDDVKLFKFHLQDVNSKRRDSGKEPIALIQLPLDPFTNYDWDHSNLEKSIANSAAACRDEVLDEYVARGYVEKQPLSAPWRLPRRPAYADATLLAAKSKQKGPKGRGAARRGPRPRPDVPTS